MFQSFNDPWPPPPPFQPAPGPQMTPREERRLVSAVCFFLLGLFLAPIAGGSLLDAVRAALSG